MSSRGIIFSKPMVRALLAGIKTQTRRKLKFQPDQPAALPPLSACPYGKPGDRLWVREAWRTLRDYDHLPPGKMAPDTPVLYEADRDRSVPSFEPGRLRQGMFMPRWASRMELEITDVRLQRLQDISEQDAAAEGVQVVRDGVTEDDYLADEEDEDLLGAVDLYRAVWESLHGVGSWDQNPWIWVVTIRTVQQLDTAVKRVTSSSL
jgi:hypothetical protein